MVGLRFRGRLAWIVAIAFGVVVLIGGLTKDITFLIVVGAVFILVGLVFLLMSIASGGRTD